MPNVLVIDDEDSICKLVAYNFQRSGFTVSTLSDGREAYEHLLNTWSRYDVIILDLMLPNMNGLDICRQLRHANIRVPIILLTARDEEVDRVLGLEIGADDYVTKPFSPRELIARARAVLRRMEAHGIPTAQEAPGDPVEYSVGQISIHVDKHEVLVRNELVELTQKEFELLHYMMKRPEIALSRDVLLDEVWGHSIVIDTRVVDVHVSHLRDKVERDPKNPEYIRTVRGVGYKLSLPMAP